MKESLLLIGPYPPPDGGTTIPFKLFCDYLLLHLNHVYDICIVNTTSGVKTKKTFLQPKTLLKLLVVAYKIAIKGVFSQKILIFGSQRFVTIIGGIVILTMKPLGKSVYIRVNGGGYDLYYKNSRFITKFIIEKLLKRADGIVVETGIVENAMKKVWANNLYKLPNYRQLKTVDKTKRNFKKNEIIFIYTGIVRKLKGVEDLLRAFLELKEVLKGGNDHKKIRLEIYGPIYSSEKEKIDLDIYKEIADIKFHGQVSNQELGKAYLSADVFVFPTYWPTEGHSGSVVEAMMYGLPIIATNWRATPEIVKDNVNGLLCEVGDTEDLKNKMYKFVVDAELRERMSKAAVDSSLQFDSNIVCEKFVEKFKLN